MFLESSVKRFAEEADIMINPAEPRPWDIVVRDKRFYRRIALESNLGAGESFMDGWWDCADLTEMFRRLLATRVSDSFLHSWPSLKLDVRSRVFNMQNRSRAFEVGKEHYDFSNVLFEHMLGGVMAYSCAYWHDATTLEEAQTAKMERICRKLKLQPGMRVLDIGCGFGVLADYIARTYDCAVVGLTVSKEQQRYATEKFGSERVEFRVADYRSFDTAEQFDRVVSVGMMEHVGYKNYRTYFEVVHRCLNDGGLFLLHTIAAQKLTTHCDPWFDRYIFPNGMLPCMRQLEQAYEGLLFHRHQEDIGKNYAPTLKAWQENLNRSWQFIDEDRVRQGKKPYSERVKRMWRYYLESVRAGFLADTMQVYQIVLSKGVVDYRFT